MNSIRKVCLLTLALATAATGAQAADMLKIAVGQQGSWETAGPEIGRRAGIFEKYGLELDILYTQGGGETQQVVISGSADIGVGVGVTGVLGAFSKGAPVRIISSQATGPADFWYVKNDSPVKSLKDYKQPLTAAFSTNGSSTHTALLRMIEGNGLDVTPVATGGPPTTLTQVLSGQIDVGWSTPPFAIDKIDNGELRIVGRMSDLPAISQQTVRVNITNASALERKPDVIARYVKAARETYNYMYDNPKAIEEFAQYAGVSTEMARRMRDEFFPKDSLDPDKFSGIETSMEDAIRFKTISQPLTAEQIKQLVIAPAQ
ncbi:sulfonate ABC transporter [Rhizobium sp. ACO-34A]|nr:sulfonate ABC transporter [Rhizobium sp. ACO-34A]